MSNMYRTFWVFMFVAVRMTNSDNVPDPTWRNISCLMPFGPSPRQLPTLATIHHLEDMVLFFGGVNDVGDQWFRDAYVIYTYNSMEDQLRFVFINTSSKMLPPYQGPGATAVWNDATRAFYVFGGGKRSTPSGPTFYDSNVWILNFDTSTWILHPSESFPGPVPSPREYHTAVNDPINNRMIIFGGRNCSANSNSDSDDQFMNDLWSFDYITGYWTLLVPNSFVIPSPRWGHAIGVFPEKFYIFGGMGPNGPLDDMYCFHFGDSGTWETIHYGYAANSTEIIEPRYLSAYFSINQSKNNEMTSKFIIYGGIGKNGTNFSREGCLHVYDLDENVFEGVVPSGDSPPDYPIVAFGTPQGIYFYSFGQWKQFNSGKCSDGILAPYEECDPGSNGDWKQCEMCYIKLCGNGVLDFDEDCDGGPMCTSNCTCPKPYFSGGTEMGCILGSPTVALVLMVLFPTLLFVGLLALIFNFVIHSIRSRRSVVKVFLM